MAEALLGPRGVHWRSRRKRAALIVVYALTCISTLVCLLFVFPAPSRNVLKDKDCTDELQAVGACHVDGNEQWKTEDVNDRWSTADWMNGYNEVTANDVNSDEYIPWADTLKAELGSSDTDPSFLAPSAFFPPPLPPNARFLSGTTIVVPTCDPLWGCKQNFACLDRWDWRGAYGGCQAYADWTRRMGWCEDDRDIYGVSASQACPVSCDTCPLGQCYDPFSKQISACAGGVSG